MLSLYKKATKDFDLRNVTPVNTAIISYGGTSIPILGKVCLRVWRGDFRCLLDRNLVKSKRVRPILGRKECPRVNIIKCLDNDPLNRPQARHPMVKFIHMIPRLLLLSLLTSCCLRGFLVSLLMV